MSTEQLGSFAKVIEKEVGINYPESNYYQLQKRLEDLVTLLGLKDIDELWLKAQGGFSPVRNLILEFATNNETSFFRDTRLFTAFEKEILPQFAAKKSVTQPLRIWSAACSTGQEPYSISMLIEQYSSGKPPFKVEILASDYSERALARAHSGKFSQIEVQRGMPAQLLVKYFTKNEEDQWQISPALRAPIQFRRFNLLEPFTHFGKFDIVFCRNVLIYQKPESKKEIIARIAKMLVPGGYLILGGAENLIGLSDEFTQLSILGAVVYQLKV
jgi:chemotaxis protein methyltransferase CheR